MCFHRKFWNRNPATQVGDVFSLEAVTRVSATVRDRAAKIVGGLDPPSAALLSDHLRPERVVGDVEARCKEILRSRLSARAPRVWYWEDFSEQELKTLSRKELGEFWRAITGLEYSKLTAGEKRLLELARGRTGEWVDKLYGAWVEIGAYEGLYESCDKIDPSLPVGDVIPLPELEQRSVDPATPYGEIFPRNVVAQGFVDAWNEMVDIWNATNQWPKRLTQRRMRPEQPFNDDADRRLIEIICDMLSAQAAKQVVDCKKMSDEELQRFEAWWRNYKRGEFHLCIRPLNQPG